MDKLSERVQEFIAERKALGGMDPNEVAGANGIFLKMADLEALCDLAKRYEEAPVSVIEGYRLDWDETLRFSAWTKQIRALNGHRARLVREPARRDG